MVEGRQFHLVISAIGHGLDILYTNDPMGEWNWDETLLSILFENEILSRRVLEYLKTSTCK